MWTCSSRIVQRASPDNGKPLVSRFAFAGGNDMSSSSGLFSTWPPRRSGRFPGGASQGVENSAKRIGITQRLGYVFIGFDSDEMYDVDRPVAGNGSFYFFSGDGGPAFTASVNKPVSLAVDGAGSLCVADLASNAIRILRATGCSLLIGALLDAASQNAGPETPGKIVANPRRGSRARRPFEADSGAGSAVRGAAHSDRRFAGRGRVLPGSQFGEPTSPGWS